MRAADTPEKVRTVFDRWTRLRISPVGVRTEVTSLGDVPAIRIAPSRHPADGALLVLHGGGYVFGSPAGYRPLAARLAKLAQAHAYLVDYRLAPEHPYPAALDDALTAYRALLERYPSSKIALVGDSAGGGLAVATMHRGRAAGLPGPACAVLFCPWLDLTGSGETMTSNADTELVIPSPVSERMALWYAADHDPAEPGLLPLFGRQDGLPPLLVQVSSGEVLRSDAERFVERARAAGVEVTFEVSADMWHVWQLMAPLVREAREAVASAGQFLSAQLNR